MNFPTMALMVQIPILPNFSVNRTACKLCLRVPSALHAPAAGYRYVGPQRSEEDEVQRFRNSFPEHKEKRK